MGSTVTYLRESIPQYVEEPVDIEVSPGELKAAMRQLAGGVSVVTAGFDEGRTGATVTSATALSVDPPTIIVNINRGSSVWPVISRHNQLCLNILAAGQKAIVDRLPGKYGATGSAPTE